MKRSIVCLFLLLGCVGPLAAQVDEIDLEIAGLESMDIAGIAWTWGDIGDGEPKMVPVIMNIGGLVESRISENYRELVKSWIDAHPNARAVVVTTIPGVSFRSGWIVKPVWVVDKTEILNVFLVRKGACPAGSMGLSADRENAPSPEQSRIFHKKLREAESLARKEKVGIWAAGNVE